MNATDFLREYFSGTEGPVCLCVYRNSDSELPRGEVAKLVSRDPKEIRGFVEKYDRPEHEAGIFFTTATLQPGKDRRVEENCRHFPSIFSDTDDKNHELDRDMVRALLENAESHPTFIVDSGHGLHPHWLLNEPGEDGDRIRTARKNIQDRTASDSVHEPNRVMRLPGTHNSKNGEWVEVKVISHRPECRYSLKSLEDWIDWAPIIVPRKPKLEAQYSSGHANGRAVYHHNYNNVDEGRVREALKCIPADSREVWLRVGMALEAELGNSGRAIWDEWSAGCTDKFDTRDQDRVWRSFKGSGIGIGTLYEYAKQHGWDSRHNKNANGFDGAHHTAAKERKQQSTVPPKATGLELVSATDVKMSAVEWLWPNRIAIGKLTLFAGMPDQGKSQILCDITGRITRTLGDKSWPCNEGAAPTGNVIMFSAEDDPSDTLIPRLLAAGADLSRVRFVSMVKTEAGSRRMFDLAADLAHLRAAIQAVGNVAMVSFDPLNAYFGHGRIDTFRGSDVRAVLGPMSDLAAELKVAVLGLLHFNKKTDVTNVMLRISDSLAFVAAARAVYAVIPDDENQRKLIVRGKNNLAPASQDKTLAYNITASTVTDGAVTTVAPHILWQPKHVEVTATEAMQAAADDRSPAQIETAMHFLSDLLAEGAVEHSEVNKATEIQQISNATLRRAAERLGIQKSKERGVKDGKWYWRLAEKGHPWPWEVSQAR